MNFSEALTLVKNGNLLARRGWNGKGMFIFHVPGSTFRVNRAPLLGIYPEGTEITYGDHIDIKAADGVVRPWLASQDDQFANDWEVVGGPLPSPAPALDPHEAMTFSPLKD